MSPPSEHAQRKIENSGSPAATVKWLHRHGYRGAAVGRDLGSDSGMMFSRPGEPIRVAWVGDALVAMADGSVRVVTDE